MSINERAKDMGVEDLVKENKRLKNDLMQDMKEITKLEEENRKLKDSNTILKKGGQVVFTLEKRIDELLEENKKLKERIKRLEFDVDAWHQLKLLLEGEIEKLRGLQICGKTVAERIEEDKKVVRE